MPFDSYSPLTAGYRGREIGGFQIMSTGDYYGCCACIGAAGTGLFYKAQLFGVPDGLALTLYEAGTIHGRTPGGRKLKLEIDSGYPAAGGIKIRIGLQTPETFRLYLRIPGWSRHSLVLVNGETDEADTGAHESHLRCRMGTASPFCWISACAFFGPLPMERIFS